MRQSFSFVVELRVKFVLKSLNEGREIVTNDEWYIMVFPNRSYYVKNMEINWKISPTLHSVTGDFDRWVDCSYDVTQSHLTTSMTPFLCAFSRRRQNKLINTYYSSGHLRACDKYYWHTNSDENDEIDNSIDNCNGDDNTIMIIAMMIITTIKRIMIIDMMMIMMIIMMTIVMMIMIMIKMVVTI